MLMKSPLSTAKVLLFIQKTKDFLNYLIKPRGIIGCFLTKPRGIITSYLIKPRGMVLLFIPQCISDSRPDNLRGGDGGADEDGT